MKKAFFCMAIAALFPLGAADVYLAGDSTMATYPESFKPHTGWGEVLQEFAKKSVTVHNHASGGRSSKSFRTEKRWDAILNSMKPGDFIIIQFGHNDQVIANPYHYADPEKDFPANLRRFIAEVRAQGGHPVIMSPTACCNFNDKGQAFNRVALQKYVNAARKVASEEKVDFINHNAWMLAELTQMGQTESQKKIFLYLPPGKYPAYPAGKEDGIHLKPSGAYYLAAGMIKLAKEQNLAIGKLFNSEPLKR